LKSDLNDFQSEIITLSLQAKGVRIVAESNRSNENAPSHRIYVGRADYAELSGMRSDVYGAEHFRGVMR
jgi:uncharacterized protein (DUF736 family)